MKRFLVSIFFLQLFLYNQVFGFSINTKNLLAGIFSIGDNSKAQICCSIQYRPPFAVSVDVFDRTIMSIEKCKAIRKPGAIKNRGMLGRIPDYSAPGSIGEKILPLDHCGLVCCSALTGISYTYPDLCDSPSKILPRNFPQCSPNTINPYITNPFSRFISLSSLSPSFKLSSAPPVPSFIPGLPPKEIICCRLFDGRAGFLYSDECYSWGGYEEEGACLALSSGGVDNSSVQRSPFSIFNFLKPR